MCAATRKKEHQYAAGAADPEPGDRFTLAIDVIDRVPNLQGPGAHLKEWLKAQIIESINYAYTEGIDKPEIRNWKWPAAKK